MGCAVQMCHCTLSLIRRRTEGGKDRRWMMEQEWKKKLMHCRNISIWFSSSRSYSAHQRHKRGWYSLSTLPLLLLHYSNSLPGTSAAVLNSFQPLNALTASGKKKKCYHPGSLNDEDGKECRSQEKGGEWYDESVKPEWESENEPVARRQLRIRDREISHDTSWDKAVGDTKAVDQEENEGESQPGRGLWMTTAL